MAWFTKKEVSKWDLAIGQKIKEARELAGMKQAELAKLVYKSQGNISDYERGELQVNALDLFLIAHALDKPAAFFVPHPLYGPTKEDQLDLKEQELIHFIRKIGDVDRERRVIDLLIAQAKNLAEVLIDTDVQAYHEVVQAEIRAKEKAQIGKK